MCFSSSTVSGEGLTLLSSNSAAFLGGRIDPGRSEDLSMTGATFEMRIDLISSDAVSTSIERRLSDPDLRY